MIKSSSSAILERKFAVQFVYKIYLGKQLHNGLSTHDNGMHSTSISYIKLFFNTVMLQMSSLYVSIHDSALINLRTASVFTICE